MHENLCMMSHVTHIGKILSLKIGRQAVFLIWWLQNNMGIYFIEWNTQTHFEPIPKRWSWKEQKNGMFTLHSQSIKFYTFQQQQNTWVINLNKNMEVNMEEKQIESMIIFLFLVVTTRSHIVLSVISRIWVWFFQ